MADTAKLKRFREALAKAHAKADVAAVAAWRAKRDAWQLALDAKELGPSISNEGLRTAILGAVDKIAEDAAAAENAGYARRSQVRELLDLLGGAPGTRNK